MRYRFRVGILCLLLSSLASAAFGQILVVEKGATEASLPVKPVQEMKLYPMGESDPALRYILWGTSLRTNPDNAFVHLLRAMVAYNEIQNRQMTEWDWQRKHTLATELPISEYPRDAAHAARQAFVEVIKELHAANRSQRLDYDYRASDDSSPMNALRGELNIVREFARLLARDARLAMAEKRYDDAIESLQAGFRIGEMTSAISGNTLWGGFIAVGIHTMMLEEVQVLCQQSDAPNMYWALASLPDSFGDLRGAAEGELEAVDRQLHSIMHLPTESISEEAWRQRVVNAIIDSMPVIQEREDLKDADRAQLIAGTVLLTQGASSKAWLVAHGTEAEVVERMSYSEAVIRCTRQEMESIKSDMLKGLMLQQGITGYDSKRNYIDAPLSAAGLLAQTLVSPISQTRWTGQNLLTLRNRLITVEAIRAYAAANDAKMPTSLDKLQPIAAWGQVRVSASFEYQRISNSEAVLRYEPVAAWQRDSAQVRLKMQTQ